MFIMSIAIAKVISIILLIFSFFKGMLPERKFVLLIQFIKNVAKQIEKVKVTHLYQENNP